MLLRLVGILVLPNGLLTNWPQYTQGAEKGKGIEQLIVLELIMDYIIIT